MSRQLKPSLCLHTNQCGAQCEAAFNTDLIVLVLSKQEQHMRLKPHGAECVQSTECVQTLIHSTEGGDGVQEDREDGRNDGWMDERTKRMKIDR